jgi:hypothetical protein
MGRGSALLTPQGVAASLGNMPNVSAAAPAEHQLFLVAHQLSCQLLGQHMHTPTPPSHCINLLEGHHTVVSEGVMETTQEQAVPLMLYMMQMCSLTYGMYDLMMLQVGVRSF